MPARTGLLRTRRPGHRAPERLRSLGGGLRSWLAVRCTRTAALRPPGGHSLRSRHSRAAASVPASLPPLTVPQRVRLGRAPRRKRRIDPLGARPLRQRTPGGRPPAPPLLRLAALHERRTSPKNRDVPKNSSSPAEGVATAAPLQRRRDRLRGLGGGSVRGSPCDGPARLRLTSLHPPPSACSAPGAPRCEGAGNRRTRGDAGGSPERGDIPISSCTLRSVPPKGENFVERNGSERARGRERSGGESPREPGSSHRKQPLSKEPQCGPGECLRER
jgi:hypothetical protein